MFTSVDKALVAVVMAIIFFVNHFFNTSITIPESTVAAVVAALTPLLVWLVPNKKA